MPVQQGVALAVTAEESGFHRIFVGEDVLSRDVFTYLSIIALKTRRVGLATGVTSPYVRNIAVLASSAAMLQRVSENRFDLGLGVGGIPEIQKLTGSTPKQPVEMLRETTITVRRLLRGEAVEFGSSNGAPPSHSFRLQKPVQMPKILFGVRGPRLLALAGELADGVIFSGSKSHLVNSKQLMEDAAIRVGRTVQELERALWLPFVAAESREDLDFAGIVVGTILMSLPQSDLESLQNLAKSVEALQSLRAGNLGAAASSVSEEMVKEFCLFGSAEDVFEERRRFDRLGFTELVIGPPFGRRYEETLKTIKQLGGE